MLIASSILTLAGLLGMGAIVAVAYVLLMRRFGGPASARSAAGRAAPAPVQQRLTVQAVVARLAAVGDEESIFLDRESHRFVTLGDTLLGDLRSGEPIEDLIDDESTLDADQLEELRTALKAGVLIPLPTKAETREFLLRERFCDELPDGEAKQQMLKVLRGQTGFRSFEGALERLGLERQWTEYRDAHFGEIAAAWLRKHGIGFERLAISDQRSESHQPSATSHQQKKPAA